MIFRCWSGLTAMALVAFASGAPGAKEKVPPPNLDGVWRGFVVYGKGEDPNRGTVHLELTIQGNAISAKPLDGQSSLPGPGVYKITGGPVFLMDGLDTQSRSRARVYQGICTVEGDVLKWCVSTPGMRRPRTFESRGQQFLLILNRQK